MNEVYFLEMCATTCTLAAPVQSHDKVGGHHCWHGVVKQQLANLFINKCIEDRQLSA